MTGSADELARDAAVCSVADDGLIVPEKQETNEPLSASKPSHLDL